MKKTRELQIDKNTQSEQIHAMTRLAHAKLCRQHRASFRPLFLGVGVNLLSSDRRRLPLSAASEAGG